MLKTIEWGKSILFNQKLAKLCELQKYKPARNINQRRLFICAYAVWNILMDVLICYNHLDNHLIGQKTLTMQLLLYTYKMDSSGGSVVKKPPAKAGDAADRGLVPGSRRAPGEGNGYSLHYSCLDHFMDRRNLAGYSPLDHKMSDTTEWLTYLNIIKIIYEKPTAQSVVKKKNKSFSSEVKNKQECLFSPLLFNIGMEVLAKPIRHGKEVKSSKLKKKEAKLHLFREDITLCVENHQDSRLTHSQTIRLINEFV